VFTARYGLGLQMKRSVLRLLKVKLTWDEVTGKSYNEERHIQLWYLN
jgi:hypothetical protein